METSLESAPPWGVRVIGWAGLAAHAATFFWYGLSGMVAPTWAAAGLLVLWLALLLAGIWLRRNRPLLTPLVPVAAMALWFAVMAVGGAWLGWTP